MIKNITVISQPGVARYEIGQNVNGMIIGRFHDNSVEYQERLHIIYTALDSENRVVVQFLDVPVVVEYGIESKGGSDE